MGPDEHLTVTNGLCPNGDPFSLNSRVGIRQLAETTQARQAFFITTAESQPPRGVRKLVQEASENNTWKGQRGQSPLVTAYHYGNKLTREHLKCKRQSERTISRQVSRSIRLDFCQAIRFTELSTVGLTM